MAESIEDVDRLSQFVPALHVDRSLLEEVVSGARRHLDHAPVRLLHNDPTVGNVFVQRVDSGWQCSGWIDWEFARHADPAWDCARLELFRDFAVPAPSPAFWINYGELNEVNLLANRLLVALFCAHVQYESKQTDPQRHAHAVNWLTRFPEQISRLYELLATSS